MTKLVNDMKNRRFHLRYEDYNGEVRLVLGMRVKVQYATGNRFSAKNGYSFTFYGADEYRELSKLIEVFDFSAALALIKRLKSGGGAQNE